MIRRFLLLLFPALGLIGSSSAQTTSFQYIFQQGQTAASVTPNSTVSINADELGATSTVTVSATYRGLTSATVTNVSLVGATSIALVNPPGSVVLHPGEGFTFSLRYTATVSSQAFAQLAIAYTEAAQPAVPPATAGSPRNVTDTFSVVGVRAGVHHRLYFAH